MLPNKLQKKLEDRKAAHAFRQLPTAYSLVDFASNDYVGFSRNTSITSSALEILETHGVSANGATGSRLLSGNHKLYEACERVIARFHESETALIFNSGYDANIGFFQSVPQRGDIILYDAYIHASIRDGIQMSNAKAYKFKHNDVEGLTQLLQKHKGNTDQSVYVITESVFSMDGDRPDLVEIAAICQANGALLVVDEAHAIGVLGDCGQGLVHALGVQVFARIVTFGKGMGAHGAAILGSQDLRDYLINFARSFIYTTGLPPHSVAIILAGYKMLSDTTSLMQLQENIAYFNEQLAVAGLEAYFIQSKSAIHCAIIPGNDRVKLLSSTLNAAGFDVKPILSPTVAKGEERLRFCLHAFNTKAEIRNVLESLKEALKR
ncbi:MAG: 8-amino-7-oxononanoate synthase [Dokdonia sp.]|jgi:8-amino-7-oxononanoate synthase